MDLSLHSKQTDAFTSLATEILYGGAAGGGKSHLMRVGAIAWCAAIPGIQVYLFRRVSNDLFKNHMEGPTSFPVLLNEWINNGWVKVNYSSNEIQFWNGSKIFLCHCQYEKDMYKYQGAEIHILMIDELTHFTEKIYRFLRGRCRLGSLYVPAEYKGQFPKILCGSNPGGPGHNWVKASFVDGAPPMQITRMPKEEGGMMRQYIPAKLSDNPTLAVNDPEYLQRLEGLGNPELVKAMRDGDWNIVAGGMFDDVFKTGLHIIEPFVIPHTWRIDRSFDWGSSKPFSVGWWAESDGCRIKLANGKYWTPPKGTLFRIGEWYGWNGKANEGCRLLAVEIARKIKEREKVMGYNVKPGPADTSIFDVENGNSIADDMAAAGCRWEKADKSPGTRKQGWEAMRKRFKAAFPLLEGRPMEEPGLFVFANCTNGFIRTVPVLVRDDGDSDDVDTDSEDHCGDEVRYRVLKSKQTPAKIRVTGF